MDKRELQELLSQAYNQENWKKIVQFVFPNVSIYSTPKQQPIRKKDEGILKSFKELGTVRLNDGKNLALFEVLLNDKPNLKINRVRLNEVVSSYIDQQQAHGVLSVFEQGGDDFRFTFSARSTEFDMEEGDFVNTETDKKRYTYVLGRNESCKTPAERFFKLSEKKDEVDITAIQNAFSVETLSKEFFDKYKKQFEKFWNYVYTNKAYNNISFGTDREKGIRDFSKKLLGRIVFLHFLQKKGWMGCTAGIKEWEDGDKQFMQTLFESYSNQSEFHSKCLSELFYNTLNKRRTDDLFVCDGLVGVLSKSKVPYLNGGLFDSDESITRKIDFPASYFQELFDFFGQFNFTIDENDPNDHEVGIDPEMLGHIFENLLEDNKDKGAFYTPKLIVQYMCQESIIEYINTKINENESPEIKSAIEDLIRNKLAEKCSDLDLVQPISNALFEVKICDPAIGSGAFPMGILNVIYSAIEELYFILPDSVASIWEISDIEWQPHLVKKNIIQHSIYGVDLESGAVDIARLRFWLALVVDEIEPKPLPNLDYKIMQGNSLLESFEGIDLSQISDASAYEEIYETEQINMFTGEAKKSVKISLNFDDVESLMDEYFNANDPDTKKEIHKKIDEQVLNHIRYTLLQHKKSLLTKKTPLERNLKLDLASAVNCQQIEKIKTTSKTAKELAKISAELDLFNEKEIKLAQLSNSNERPFFLWKLFFKEVFDEGGFDIVIGNPPYVNVEKIDPIIKNNIQKFSTAYQKYDLYVLFYELSINILKDKGILSFITSNKFLSQGYGLKLRELLLKFTIQLITNFNYDIFDSATVRTCILQLKKHLINENEIKIIDVNAKKDYEKFNSRIYSYLKQSIFSELEENNFRINLNNEKLKLINKIGRNSDRVDEICSVNYGLRPSSEKLGLKKADFIFMDNPQNKFKKYFEGKDMGYWTIKAKSFLNYSPDVMYNAMFTELFENEKLVGLRTLSDITKLRFIYDDENYYCNDSVVVLTLWEKFEKVNYQTIKRLISQEKIKCSQNYDLKYLQIILNSKLIKFYVNELLYDGTHFYPDHMKQLPIKNTSKKNQQLFHKYANTLIEFEKNDVENNDLISKIDMMVFKLYNLTYEEVKLIDSDFVINVKEEDYNKFQF